MKAKLFYSSPDKCWVSVLPPKALTQRFLTFEAAAFSVHSYYERANRWLKADKIIFELNEALLSIEERDMIQGITGTNKCTKRQYGWLKGILERQKL